MNSLNFFSSSLRVRSPPGALAICLCLAVLALFAGTGEVSAAGASGTRPLSKTQGMGRPPRFFDPLPPRLTEGFSPDSSSPNFSAIGVPIKAKPVMQKKPAAKPAAPKLVAPTLAVSKPPTAPTPSAPKPSAPKSTALKPSAPKSTAPKPSAPKPSAPASTALKPSAPKSTAHKSTTLMSPASSSIILACPSVPASISNEDSKDPAKASSKPWLDEPSDKEKKLDISGTKTFEMKKANVKGDIGHFSTENYESIPGFRLDQSLHLEIDGNITHSARVNAVLDDKEDEDRRFTINVDGPLWNLTMGDFPVAIPDTEFTLFKKEVRGIMAQGGFSPAWQGTFLFSQSKGQARREQFRGAGQQQEFRLKGQPVVQNSEHISIDGRVLSRGTDYLIDYEDGIVKLLPHILPVEITSWIVAEYEVTDSKLAFKRNLLGLRLVNQRDEGRRIGFTWLREADDTIPKGDTEASGTVRPMEHQILGLDANWTFGKWIKLAGETALSMLDPNIKSEASPQDQLIKDHASRLSLEAKGERLDGEISMKRIGKDFKLVGRESGVTELGERGLVNDILKDSGRLTYKIRPTVDAFGTLEQSRTNLSDDKLIPTIKFGEKTGGVSWKFKPKSKLEARYGVQADREEGLLTHLDRGRDMGAVVWDHDFGSIYSQSKLEHTQYSDAVNSSSGSKVLQMQTSIGMDKSKNFKWSVGAGKISVDDDLDPNQLRSDTRNYTLDMNYDPNRVLSTRGIFQWRTEEDFLAKSKQDSQIADSRFQYQPNRDLRAQFKYKIENTSKVLRDATLDPTKYQLPPSLPLETHNQEEVIGRFENPVQKSTSNFSLNYQPREAIETFFDWKRRDLKDRATKLVVSFNDRETYEVRFTPMRRLKVSTEYEQGVSRNRVLVNELRDSAKRLEVRHEIREGYVLNTKVEDRDENDIYTNDNDKRTLSKSMDFQRIFSRRATLEAGVQRNVITFKQPSKEWETRAALVLTPEARNQRYRFFLTHTKIESERPGSKFEGGLTFSQIIGMDTMLDGEIKKVKATASLSGNGYEALVANAKMVITF